MLERSSSAWLTRFRDELLGVDHMALYLMFGLGTLLIAYVASRLISKRKLPPGPWLLSARNQNEVDVAEMDALVKKYGPIINFRFLSLNMLFLCDVDSIRDALVGQADAFSGRPQVAVFRSIHKDCGVVFIDGPKWQEHRRFVLSVLRSFGFGKNITERIVQEELVLLCDELKKQAGWSVYPRTHLIKSVSNVVCLLMFGERCGTEKDFDLLVRVANDTITVRAFNSILVMMLYKLILLLPGDYFEIKKFLSDLNKLKQYIDKKIAEHRDTIDWDNERDLIDAYLVEMRKRDQGNPAKHTFTDFQLFRVMIELFLAGMETTSTMLNWAILLMAKHPHVQARVQAEIDSVIGDKLPQIADRAKLVYTTAVLHEVERYATVTPFSLLHRVTEDTEVRGYYIPKDTIVTPYLFGAHRDERIWKNPKQFDPSHFYDESSNSLVNVQNLLTFGAGKRACLGESLATQELFVFFAGLLQRFSLEADAQHPLPIIPDQRFQASVRMAPEYRVFMRERCVSS